jgi:hypothetical protein
VNNGHKKFYNIGSCTFGNGKHYCQDDHPDPRRNKKTEKIVLGDISKIESGDVFGNASSWPSSLAGWLSTKGSTSQTVPMWMSCQRTIWPSGCSTVLLWQAFPA